MGTVTLYNFQRDWTTPGQDLSVKVTRTEVNPLDLLKENLLRAALDNTLLDNTQRQEIRAYLEQNGKKKVGAALAKQEEPATKLESYSDFFKCQHATAEEGPKRIYLTDVTAKNCTTLLEQAKTLFVQEVISVDQKDRADFEDGKIFQIQNLLRVIFSLAYLDLTKEQPNLFQFKLGTDPFEKNHEQLRTSFAENADMGNTVSKLLPSGRKIVYHINPVLGKMRGIAVAVDNRSNEFKAFVNFMKADWANLRSTFIALYNDSTKPKSN